MLSIGKVGGGQAGPRYYVDTVAKGREDYYTGQGEAHGVWAGSAAPGRGLWGTVEEDDFLTLLSSVAADGRTVMGYDLTFSAPKSVSVLFGVAEHAQSRAIRDAHDRAVTEALGYIEREACWTRRGRGGGRRIEGDGLTIAGFRHRTSRAGDPQLHTHAVVANTTEAEGRATALDGQALYAHARTAGYLYQAALRGELTRVLGVRWKPVTNGVADIQGVDEDVLRHFSRRTEQIREHMARRGEHSMKAARIATLETRRAKTHDVPADRLHDEWRARASELGFDTAAVRSVVGGGTSRGVPPPDVSVVANAMAAPGGVTRHASTFDRRDVLRDWAEAHRDGTSVAEIEALTDAWLASEHAVQLEDATRRRHLGGARFSTPQMLELERALIKEAAARQGADVARADKELVEAAIAKEFALTGEQRELARRLTTSGDGVQIVRAAAGTGKTYALAVARNAWERSGVPVHGCALAARAAVELETLAGIDSSTIARLQQDLDHGYGLPHGGVLVVDEAGMVGTRAIARLADACAQTTSKLVLVGDDLQLPEIDAGGAFRGLAKRLGAIELLTVRRQAEAWDRDALSALRSGRVRAWAEAYRHHGRLVARPTAAQVREALVDDWWTATRRDGEDSVMLAHRRVDVAELNARARARMHEDGRLSETEVVIDGRAFAVGDRVIARRNSARLGIVNGSRGDVIAVDEARDSVELRLRNGDVRAVDSSYLHEGALDHGYALTAHAAQGATVDRAFVLGSDELYREWGYTAMSRHRFEGRFYVVSPGTVERALPGLEPEPDPLVEDLIQTLGPSHRKELAHDVLGDGRAAVAPTDNRRLLELAQAAAEARARAADLGQERDGLSRLQWSRRAQLQTLAEAHVAEAERVGELVASARTEAPHVMTDLASKPDAAAMDASALRSLLVDPSDDVIAALGDRPAGLAGRPTWLRAAATVVRDHTVELAPPLPAGTMDDMNLEL